MIPPNKQKALYQIVFILFRKNEGKTWVSKLSNFTKGLTKIPPLKIKCTLPEKNPCRGCPMTTQKEHTPPTYALNLYLHIRQFFLKDRGQSVSETTHRMVGDTETW